MASRVSWLKIQSLETSLATGAPVQLFGAGSGFGGSPSDCPPPEQREHRRRSSPCYGSVSGPRRVAGKRSAATLISDALGELIGGLIRRVRDLVPFSRAGRSRAIPAMTSAVAPRAASATPKRLQARLQGAQRLRQPPPCRASQGTGVGAARFIQHVKTDHRPAGPYRRMQGRVIGKAEVVAEPDDAGRVCHKRAIPIEFPSLCLGLRLVNAIVSKNVQILDFSRGFWICLRGRLGSTCRR